MKFLLITTWKINCKFWRVSLFFIYCRFLLRVNPTKLRSSTLILRKKVWSNGCSNRDCFIWIVISFIICLLAKKICGIWLCWEQSTWNWLSFTRIKLFLWLIQCELVIFCRIIFLASKLKIERLFFIAVFISKQHSIWLWRLSESK